ncbi:Ribonuclease VapC [Crenothrix polyspora]|uniref:Ribonuclease VapC n=1 Tax=Crenothrix polyspora TaxID=360316 RepID=A0A1R4HDC7_9GAMM|nr:type II toxin-antitoxin system VapC family toxin [Crenothrix polyspora]SJM94214.1 Ribonuclease VapC [Crenothrix polyspora]
MIVLDTNIVSEVMRPQPSASVLAWLNQQINHHLFITSVSIAEIGYGLRVLADGQRRKLLQSRFEQFIAQGFEYRILSFDNASARVYADIMGHRKEMGCPMSFPDAQIAAITRTHNSKLATRNIKDFQFCGLDLTNPFG